MSGRRTNTIVNTHRQPSVHQAGPIVRPGTAAVPSSIRSSALRAQAVHPSSHQGGSTLLELAMAAAVFSLLGYGIMTATQTSQAGYSEMLFATNANHGLRRAMHAVIAHLRYASPATVTVTTSNPDYDELIYQIPVAVGNGQTIYGYRDQNGAAQTGWKVRFTVSNGNLIKQILDASGVPQGSDEILLENIDGLESGVKGFDVSQVDADLYEITIRTATTSLENILRKSSQQTSVYLSNT